MGVSGKPSKDQFARLVLDAIRQAGEKADLRYESDQFRLIVCGEKTDFFNLDNAFGEYCAAADAKKPDVLRRFVRTWFSRGKGVPEDFEDTRPDLLPVLRSRSYFELLRWELDAKDRPKLKWQYRVIGEHFGLGIAYDLPESMLMISQHHLDGWKVSFDEALQAAMDNLATISKHEFDSPLPGVWVSPWRDNYDAGRLMLLDLIRRHQVKGDYVAMAPNRDTLILTGSQDEEGLTKATDLAEEALNNPRPLTGLALRLVGQEWQPFLPPADHPQHHRFKVLWLQSVGQHYKEQKELLEKSFETSGEDVFVASFMGMQSNETGQVQSYCVWSEGVDTLLPKTDVACFFRPGVAGKKGKTVAQVEWNRVCQVVGHLMERTDLYPERYRVKTFPSKEQLAAMKTGQ